MYRDWIEFTFQIIQYYSSSIPMNRLTKCTFVVVVEQNNEVDDEVKKNVGIASTMLAEHK